MSFLLRAVSCVLCTCVFLSPAIGAQDKDAIAVAPMRDDDSAPHTEVGVKAAVPTHNAETKAAVFLPPDNKNNGPQVRLVAIKTDVAKRYRAIVPPFPIPPFNEWRQWFRDHEESVHCALEWCNKNGDWFHGELRSVHFDANAAQYRVGWGEFPGTAYDAYGIYIIPGRVARDVDDKGRPLVVTVDEKVPCEPDRVEAEIRKYGEKNARPGETGTGGKGRHNVGLGGPAYKPSQNSNTMIKYVLRACGYTRSAPAQAVGWETEPSFPYSSSADSFPDDTRP